MIIAMYVVLATITLGYLFMAAWTKSEKWAGLALIPLIVFVGIVLATSDEIKNKINVSTQSVSIEPRLKLIETDQQDIKTNQRQLSETTNRILKVMELENSKPKLLILHSEKTLKNAEKYDDSINTLKKELKDIK